jgi:phage antirepressor YoqD-like protein
MERGYEESADEGATRRRTERAIELAAMFKEAKEGTDSLMKRIVAKFALQEGIRLTNAKTYLNLLIDSQLLYVTKGHKRWKYQEEAEWDLFKVKI